MNVYKWQEDVIGGLKKGQLFIVGHSRRGKSMFIPSTYLSAWGEWEPVWSWRRRKSITGKMIWGRVVRRRHQLALVKRGKQPWTQYATKKEAFMRALKDEY